jgi:hypothetical protein
LQFIDAWKAMGMHPGKWFVEWMRGKLEEYGIYNQADLNKKLKLQASSLRAGKLARNPGCCISAAMLCPI